MFSLSIGGIAGPGLVEKLGKKVYHSIKDVYRLDSEVKILEYATDSLFWLVESAKEESQIDLYSLKSGLTSSHLVDALILQIKESTNLDLKLRVIKITEFFSDHTDFFLLIEQKQLFDELLLLFESPKHKADPQHASELEIGIFGYFLKGVRHGIFKDAALPNKLTKLTLAKVL